ncbi:tetratricopeptide repeat protein [Zunongwangia sp.]|uniref:tetratricopeptide repeat protein n=1 Tax=Zunongwangia sp. TaxID=1965325 RepID=UPI003AA99BD1
MTTRKIYLSVVFFLVIQFGFAQQSAIYTSDLAKFNKALDLYNNQQFLPAQQLFAAAKETATDEKIKGDCAYYIANAAVRLKQPNADELMERFVSNYPMSSKTNSAYRDVATFYFNTGKYTLARKWYDKVDENNLTAAESQQYYFNKGYVYFQTNDFDAARTYFNRVLDSEKYGAQAKYYIGYMAYENDDYNKANQYFDEVKGNSQFSKDLSYYQADMNFKLGKFKEAIKQGKEQLPKSNFREKSQLNKIIGESYFNLKKYDEAIPYLKEYQGLRGKWNNTDYYQLGYAYYKQGDYEKAISEFNKIIDGKNSIAQNAYYHLAQSYLEAGKKQEALNAFKNASEMDFNLDIKEDALLNYAKLSYEIGNSYESASKVLLRYLKTYPDTKNRQEAEELLVSSFITSGNFEEAMELLEKNRNFADKVAYQKVAYYYGLELYKDGDFYKAIENFDKALKEPRDLQITAKATYWKAESQYNVNKIDDAIIGYKLFEGMSAANGTPEMENLNYNLGYAYFKKNEYKNAITYFKKFANNDANEPAKKYDAYLRLGDSYFATSSYWPAMEAYNKAIAGGISNADYAAFQKAISYGFVDRKEKKIQDLSDFNASYPRSSYRDDALYELGNTYLATSNNKKAIDSYNRLISEVPKSAFVPKAMLRQGLIYFNNNQGENALSKFKKVVSEYPNTPEAREAVSTARNVYVDLGRADEYANWVKNIDFVEVSNADIDNTTYEAAENQYFANNKDKAASNFEKYLKSFPNGIHAINAHYYLAELEYRDEDKTDAISHFEYVLDKPTNEFTEKSLAKLSQIYLSNRNYKKAMPVLKRLEAEARDTDNKIYAQSNLMKSYEELNQPEEAARYADQILTNNAADEQAKTDAQLIVARSAVKSGNLSKAKKAYAQVQKTATGKIAAEALYYDAYFKNEGKNYEASNAAVQVLAKEFSGYKFWGAKGLVLMAKNFYALGDAYQATYLLDNVQKNFTKYPDVVQEAKAELTKIKAEQAKTNSSVNTDNN